MSGLNSTGQRRQTEPPKYATLQWEHDQQVATHPYPHSPKRIRSTSDRRRGGPNTAQTATPASTTINPERRTVRTSRVDDHDRPHLIVIELRWPCPSCGSPLEEVITTVLADGSHRPTDDGWQRLAQPHANSLMTPPAIDDGQDNLDEQKQ